jgi:hypothetical protein
MVFVPHHFTNSLLPVTRRLLPLIRRLATLCLLLALLLQTFSKLMVITEFYANRDYIARNLCINRKNSTAISCYGTCQLNKRLKHENKDSNAEHRPDTRNESISCRSFYLTGFNPYRQYIIRRYPAAPSAHPIDQPSSHFHPPDREA